MLSFGGIFDDLPDDLKSWVETGASAYSRYRKRQEEEAKEALSYKNMTAKASATRSTAQASQSVAVQSEDPYAFEARWKDRMNTYANVDRMTGVKV